MKRCDSLETIVERCCSLPSTRQQFWISKVFSKFMGRVDEKAAFCAAVLSGFDLLHTGSLQSRDDAFCLLIICRGLRQNEIDDLNIDFYGPHQGSMQMEAF
jgi:hypothetical protein